MSATIALSVAGASILPQPYDETRYTLRKKLRAHMPDKPQVWLARDRRLGCHVVLKRYSGERLTQLWEQETRLLSLGLPQLPRLMDAYMQPDGVCILAREYIPGASLSEIVAAHRDNSSRIDWLARVLQLGARAARLTHGLHTARPKGVSICGASATDFLLCEGVGDISDGAIRLLPTIDLDKPQFGGAEIRGDIGRLGEIVVALLHAVFGTDSAAPHAPADVAEILAQATHADPDQRQTSALWLAQALEQAAVELAKARSRPAGSPHAAAKPVAEVETCLVAAGDTLAWHRLRTGQFATDITLAHAAHGLRDIISIGSDPSRLRALETVECARYPHQLETVRQVVSRPEMSAGAILSDEVGLGKTIEALLICQELRARGQANSVLIVTSPSGAAQWLAECRRRIRRELGAPEFHVYGSERDLNRSLLIVSSATMRRARSLHQILQARRDDLVIVDEAHQCCGERGVGLSQLGAAITRLHRKRLLLLTATPISSHPAELGVLADLIQPGLLDDSLTRIDPASMAGPARMNALRMRMQAIMVRHRRADLAASLPAPEIAVRRITVPVATLAAKARVASDLICGEWGNERVVAFCRSPQARSALAVAIRARTPNRAVIHFQGGRREQRAQEAAFAEYADAVMIAGDRVAEGMNWQQARCLLHLDVPLTPIVWEQRVGRIVRLGQRAKRLDIAHFQAGDGEARALDLYERSLGLFTLSVGEAAGVLDHASNGAIRNMERPIRALVSGNGMSEQRYLSLAAELSSARAAYKQRKRDNLLLDELFPENCQASSAQTSGCNGHDGDADVQQERLADCVSMVLHRLGASVQKTRFGSSVFAARFDGAARDSSAARALLDADSDALLYTFDASRWEEGSRVRYLTRHSPIVQRLCALALADCAVVEAHYAVVARSGAADTLAYEPYLAAGFCASVAGNQPRESTEWLAVSLLSGKCKRLGSNPLDPARYRPGPPPSARQSAAFSCVSPETTARALQLLAALFNRDLIAALNKRRDSAQVLHQQAIESIYAASNVSDAARDAALERSRLRESVRLETSLLSTVLLWVPSEGQRAGE